MNLKSERFEMRFDPTTLDRIDNWRREQGQIGSRAEAIRELVERGLERSAELHFSAGEKLLISMTGTLMKHCGADGGVNPAFVEEAMSWGHYWALDEEYPGVFHKHVDSRRVRSETGNILDMWDRIEDAVHKLNNDRKEELLKEFPAWGNGIFPGFGGNDEAEHLNIARFLIERMQRFTRFADRDLDSHLPMVDAYRRALRVYEPVRINLVGRTLSLSELKQIMKEHTDPSHR